jgi:uncharacterized protein
LAKKQREIMTPSRIFYKLKKTYMKLVHINASPQQIAMGFAVGAFIGVFPTFGLGWFLAIGLSFIFGLNFVSTIIGSVVIMNPITSPFFWSLSAFVGSFFFGKEPTYILKIIKAEGFFHSLNEIALIYLIGNIVVSTLTSVFFYFAVKLLVVYYRARKNLVHNKEH